MTTAGARVRRATIGAAMVIATILTGCATAVRDVQTPFGARGGDVFERLEILGFSSRSTATPNLANSADFWTETVKLNVPVGTKYIVPTNRALFFGFGSGSPEAANAPFTWIPNDRPLGAALARIEVTDIDAPDFSTSPPTQTATIEVSLYLSDVNHDDPWFAKVSYTLLFLGPPQRRPRPDAPIPR